MGNEECCCTECECLIGTDCCPEDGTVSIDHNGAVPIDYFGGGILTLSNAFTVFDFTCFPFPDITAYACQWFGFNIISATPGTGQEHWKYLAWLYRTDLDQPLRAYVVAAWYKDYGEGLQRIAEYFVDTEILPDDWDCSLEEELTLDRCYENPDEDAPIGAGTIAVGLDFT